jgi:hypothetical protein
VEKYRWSLLTNLQIGKYAEYFVKMEFTLHRFDVYTSEVDDKGIDFIVCDDRRERYYDVQVKSVLLRSPGEPSGGNSGLTRARTAGVVPGPFARMAATEPALR